MAQNNATCSICGNPYYKCLSCRDTMKLRPWQMYTDSSEHYKVLQAIRGYNTGVYTKDELKSKLKNMDLSDLESYKEHIKALIRDVLKEEPVVETAEVVAEKAEEIVEVVVEKVEETAEAMITTEEAVEEVVIEKPSHSRKRNYKVNNEAEEE